MNAPMMEELQALQADLVTLEGMRNFLSARADRLDSIVALVQLKIVAGGSC